MDHDSLGVFYSRLFPFELLARWVGYGSREYLERREFACEIGLGGGETAFRRHMSFATGEELRREFCALAPNRIEIGPVYTHPPRLRDSYATFAAQERELIFDIDMNDYDEVRTCCKDANVCQCCWPLATTAMKVFARVLTSCFGFKHLLFVFSGRRGIHCWVADERARKLSSEAREAIVEFLTVVRGGQGSLGSRVRLNFPLHPALQAVYNDVLLPFFEQHFLEAQHVLEDPASDETLLSFLPDKSLQDELRALWSDMHDPRAKWGTLKNFCAQKRASKQGHLFNFDPVAAIVFGHTFPRLDSNVTRVVNHLLKSPFCVHPGTGRISVPIDLEDCDAFDPTAVPTMADLLRDIDEFDQDAMAVDAGAAAESDLHKTRLAPAVSLFERFVSAIPPIAEQKASS